MRAVRRGDGSWRTIDKADLIVVAVPARDSANAIEVIGFDPLPVIAAFNDALRDLPLGTATDTPVIVALDKIARGRSRSVPSGLKSKARWHYVLPLEEPRLAANEIAPTREHFVERVKREFAELNGVDVSKVAVEFKILS